MRCRALLLSVGALLFAANAIGAPPQRAAAGELDSLPLHAAPLARIDKALAQPASKTRPLRVAVAVPLSLGLPDGVWDAPASGESRWRSRVFSAGARFLALEFSRFALPANAELWIYDAHGTSLQGPYTQANQTPEGKLWTAMLPTDTAVIELQVPTASIHEVSIQLGRLDHGTQPFDKAGVTGGNAGSCNIDVICAQGNGYRKEIRSVAVYTVSDGNGLTACSGQLVNNVRQNSTPYFLSARHCGVSSSNASSMVFYWNFQKSACNSGTASQNQTQTGASFRASDSRSDFLLVQLSQAPASQFNVHYAGWDIASTSPQSGASLHHPSGDVKKISLYATAATRTDSVLIDGRPTDVWDVRWSQGTTEPGSSGAGLYNQNNQIVGVLSGGDASCSNLGGSDYFGRLDKAWQANSASNGQLKFWLDPDNTGRTELCGQNPGSPCSAGSSPPPADSASGGMPGLWLLWIFSLAALRHQRRPFMPRRSSGVSSR
mgnify:CR=1 FL=1